MDDLVVDGRPIIPIRGIPAHTGNFVDALDVAQLLAYPQSFGEMTGGFTGHYLDKAAGCHPMFAYEFTEMHRTLAVAPDTAVGAEWIKMLMPGVLVFRKDLERVLYEFWDHCTSRGAAMDREEYEFNPAPRMTADEELLIYAGFEDLLTHGKVASGTFLNPTERRNEAFRILRELVRLAGKNNIPFDLKAPPGQMADMCALLRRRSRAFDAIQDDALAGYINQFGCHFKGGRPSKTVLTTHALYELM